VCMYFFQKPGLRERLCWIPLARTNQLPTIIRRDATVGPLFGTNSRVRRAIATLSVRQPQRLRRALAKHGICPWQIPSWTQTLEPVRRHRLPHRPANSDSFAGTRECRACKKAAIPIPFLRVSVLFSPQSAFSRGIAGKFKRPAEQTDPADIFSNGLFGRGRRPVQKNFSGEFRNGEVPTARRRGPGAAPSQTSSVARQTAKNAP